MASTLGPTELSNLALSKLGPAAGFLTAFDTDTSSVAQACRRVYAPMRDEVVEAHPWRFARKRAALAADTAVPAWGFAQQFVLPADFLRLLSTENEAVDYEIEGGVIMCDDDAPLNIRYLAQVTDTSKFSPTFVSALACRMAVELCEPVTKSTTKKQSLWAEYQMLLKQARRTEMMGVASDPAPDGDFVNSRL